MRDPLDSFGSLQEFFVRALRDGARPIAAGADALVAPCDGAWGESGRVTGGTLLQLKGRPYALADLLASGEDAARFEGGSFATFYLAPRDYHRFHSPCPARVERAVYVPGNALAGEPARPQGVDALFAQNERICAFLRAPGDALLCLVAVGATLVGKIRVSFDALETNLPGARAGAATYPDGVALARGEEWGPSSSARPWCCCAARGGRARCAARRDRLAWASASAAYARRCDVIPGTRDGSPASRSVWGEGAPRWQRRTSWAWPTPRTCCAAPASAEPRRS